MMKRIGSVLCAAVMLAVLCSGAWAAAVDYTLEEKLQKQLISSGLRGSVTFAADGDGFWGIDEAGWALIRSLLPDVTVDASSTVLSASQKDRETKIEVKKNGASAGQADILTDGDTVVFTCDMIGEGTWYSMARNADPTGFLFSSGEGAWPGVWHLFWELALADDDWQTRAASASSGYMTKIGVWMQALQEVSLDTSEGELRVNQHCEISGEELKAEMKQLMADLYGDREMLGLLSEIFTPEESAAYLQPSMMDTFFSMLDAVDITSSVVVERVFDIYGNCLKETVTLPFGSSDRLAHVTVSVKGTEGEKEYALTGAYRGTDGGATLYPFMISVIPFGSEGIYNGSVSISYPLPESDEFTVDESAPAAGTLEAEFALGIDEGEETYSASEDLCLRERSVTLTLRPMTGDTTGFHTMSLSMTLILSSKSRQTAATNIQFSATVTDQDLGGYIGMEATFKTASKWEPARIQSLTAEPIRLDALSKEASRLTRENWVKEMISWFAENLLISDD